LLNIPKSTHIFKKEKISDLNSRLCKIEKKEKNQNFPTEILQIFLKKSRLEKKREHIETEIRIFLEQISKRVKCDLLS
jgi:hypothetical protein